MAADLNEAIPGLQDALDRYKQAQLEAFAGIEPSICGKIIINPFTPQMFVELDGCDNAFFRDKEPNAGDVAAFLWRTSPTYKRENNEDRLVFIGLINGLPFEQAALEIYNYLSRTWMGMPQWKYSRASHQSAATWVSRLVHVFAKTYGWTEQEVIHLPFRRLWQYMNRIMEDNDERYKEHCPEAMKLRSDFLKRENEKTKHSDK